MERARDSRSLAVNTRELREIAREAHHLNYNRNLTPAQFKLLDPKGTHILSLRQVHKHAHEVPVDPHMRMYAHIKLLGQPKAIERYQDVPMHFVLPFFEPEEMFDPDDPDIKKFMEEATALLESGEAGEGDLPPNFEEVAQEIRDMANEDKVGK
jgi:hypothetical protein